MFASVSKMNALTKDRLMFGLMVALVLAVVAGPVLAGSTSTNTDFDAIWSTLTDWMTGTLGKVASGAMILVGIIAGVARGSIMAFAVGIGGGVGLYNTPTIIDSVFSATLQAAPKAVEAAVVISNGLGV